jgi:hypothetical protein
LSAQSLAVFFEGVTVKLLPIINSQFSWNPESADYVLPEEFLDCWCRSPRPQLRICNFLELLAAVQLDPFPTFAKAMTGELDELVWMASFADSLFFDMLHIPKLAFSHQCLW